MAASNSDRTRSYLYLLAGVLLLIAQLIRFPKYYEAWQANSLDYTRLVMSMIGIVLALYFLRMGWRLRRNDRQDDVLD